MAPPRPSPRGEKSSAATARHLMKRDNPPPNTSSGPPEKAGRRGAPSPAAALDHPIPETDGMTMDFIFCQPGDIAPLSLPALLPAGAAPVVPIPGISQLDRISRLAALGPEDTVAGLLWLAMNFPAVCDAMLDKTEFDAADD